MMAKRLLQGRGVDFTEIPVDGDQGKRRWLAEVTGQFTVPQVFIHEHSIGGYSELSALDRSGALLPMIEGKEPVQR